MCVKQNALIEIRYLAYRYIDSLRNLGDTTHACSLLGVVPLARRFPLRPRQCLPESRALEYPSDSNLYDASFLDVSVRVCKI